MSDNNETHTAESDRPRVHLWLTSGDQRFLIAVCIILVAVLAVRAWSSAGNDAAAEILQTDKPDIGYRIDLNSAPAEELQQLRLIGPVRAAQIVEDRELNGEFGTIDDLQRIKGIGPKTIEKNRRWMRAGDDETIDESAED